MILGILEELGVSAIERKCQAKDPRGTRLYPPKMMVVPATAGTQRRNPSFTEAGEAWKLEKATYEAIPFRSGRWGATRPPRGSRSFAKSISMS